MEKIKLCPLCSGKSEFNITDYDGNKTMKQCWINIRCKKCLLEQPKVYRLEVMLCKDGNIKTLIDERDKAISDWNRRANND